VSTEFNLALVNEVVAAAVPDREVLVWRDRRLTYAQLAERSRRLASYLHSRGLGVRAERSHLAGHESGQRSPSGKPDYRWARQVAEGAAT
jgi:non-ribosomal peptide synthetase component F